MPEPTRSFPPTEGSLHPFGVALASRDVEAAAALLSPDVVFHSPIVFQPYCGRDAVVPILRAVTQTLTDFSYVWSIADGNTGDHALIFRATVGGRQIEGCDFLRLDADGLVAELTVMVRPLSAAQQLAATMAARLTGTV